MKQRASRARLILASLVLAACAVALTTLARGKETDDSSPIFGVKIPSGYRNWELIAPSHEAGGFNELRGILGNDTAMKAYREAILPFPDGAMLAKLAWKQEPSTEFDGAFVPGRATTVQIMVKDFEEIRIDRRMGLRPLHRRDGCRSRPTRNMFRLPSGPREGSRLRLHPARSVTSNRDTRVP